MEIHISKFDATVWIALFLAVLSTIAIACLGFSERFSRTRTWRISLGAMVSHNSVPRVSGSRRTARTIRT
jgi:hypothetical protein